MPVPHREMSEEDPVEIRENPLQLKAPAQKKMSDIPEKKEPQDTSNTEGIDPCICCMYACCCISCLLGLEEVY